ncbi:hypothetical protein ACFWVF_36995 [Streptomyces sp. NPDC058659]|uniref:hypothetical protein n=1 Tax=unclassified Streptomyces TaxID=2593676 RepID=UPI00364D4C2C
MADVAPDVAGVEFTGPDGPAEPRGAPTRVRRAAAEAGTGRRLWEVSEGLTGVRFPVTAS